MKAQRSRMRLFYASFFLAVIASSSPAVSAPSSDLVVDYPTGWIAAGSMVPHSAGPVSAAVTAYKYKTGDPSSVFDRSLVMQAQTSGEISSTEFDGKVFDIAYSPTGSHLLVHRVGGSDLARGEIGVHLVDSGGQLIWSRVELHRMFFFSLTGNVLYAWYPGHVNPEDRGRSIEFFDLSGQSLGTLALDAQIVGVVVPDNEEVALFVTLRSVICLRAGPPIATEWRVDLPSNYPDAQSVRPLDSRQFTVKLKRAARVVVSVDGSIKYTFDPTALGDADPWLGPERYARYRMSPGPAPEEMMLFDGTPGAQILHLSTNELTKIAVDTSPPEPRYTLSPYVVDRRLFFFSETGVRIRSVQD